MDFSIYLSLSAALSQPLTERSTRNNPGSIRRPGGRPARKADNLTAISEPIDQKMWESRRLTTLWASTSCYRDSFTFIIIIIIIISAVLQRIVKSKIGQNEINASQNFPYEQNQMKSRIYHNTLHSVIQQTPELNTLLHKHLTLCRLMT
jgi:hypothetical protein